MFLYIESNDEGGKKVKVVKEKNINEIKINY